MEDHERAELIRSLVLEAGRLMEDLSPELALVLPSGSLARLTRVEELHESSAQIAALLGAALVLQTSSAPSDAGATA